MTAVAAPAPAVPRDVVRGGLAALVAFAAAAVGAGLGRAVVTTYLPVLLDRIDDEPGLIGTVMLVNAGAGFAVPLVVGLWSDRLRARGYGRTMPFILGGSLVTAAGLVAVALGSGSSYLTLAVFGGVVYVGLNAVTTAHRALVPDTFEPGDRARATGAQELAMLLGGLVGVAAGGVLVEVSAGAPFALAALVVPLVTLPTVLRMVRREQSEPAERADTGPGGAYYLRAALRPGVRALLTAQVLWVLGYAALPAFFILYAGRVLGMTPAEAALWLVAFGAATGLTMVAAGRARNPARHKLLLVIGVLLMGGGLLGVAAATEPLAAGPGLLATAVGFGLLSTIGFPLYAALIPPGEAGSYTALYFSVRAISSAVALPVAGWAIAASGSYRTLFVLGGVATLSALVPLATVCGDRSDAPCRTWRFPRPLWLLRWIGAVGAVFAGALASGLLLGATALARIDEELFRAVNQLGPAPDVVWDVLNPHTRNYVALTIVAAVAAALWLPRRVPHVVSFVTLSWLLGLGLHELIHLAWNRPRPEEVLGAENVVLDGSTWAHIASFPSGHMVVTTALVASIVMLFPRLRTPLVVYLFAVGATRVVFGAHFPVDVLIGTVIGALSARLTYALLSEMRVLDASFSIHAADSPTRMPSTAPASTSRP